MSDFLLGPRLHFLASFLFVFSLPLSFSFSFVLVNLWVMIRRGLSNGSHIGMRGSRNRRHWRLYWSRYRRPRLCDVTFGVLMILDNTMSMSLQLVDEKSRERFSSRGAYTYDHQSAGERSVSRHCSAESPERGDATLTLHEAQSPRQTSGIPGWLSADPRLFSWVLLPA